MHDDRETALGMSRREVLALLAAVGGVMLARRSSAEAGSASSTSGELPSCGADRRTVFCRRASQPLRHSGSTPRTER
jgi:hypothetical protein